MCCARHADFIEKYCLAYLGKTKLTLPDRLSFHISHPNRVSQELKRENRFCTYFNEVCKQVGFPLIRKQI
jgi:hypothetical protein